MQDLEEAVRSIVVVLLLLSQMFTWSLLVFSQTMNLVEHYNLVDFSVNVATRVGQAHVLLQRIAVGFRMRLQVINLLIEDRLALGGITDTHEGHTTE